MAPRQEPRDEIETAIELRREGDNAHIWCSPFDFAQNVAGFEGEATVVGFRHRGVATGPHVEGGAGAAKTCRGLRAFVLGVDEVAFQMSWQNARGAWAGRLPRTPDLLQHTAQRFRRAGDSGRAERGNAVPRQARGDRRDCIAGL